MISALTNCATQWSYSSTQSYADPIRDVRLDVVITDDRGNQQTVPAFWAGEQSWTVRYAPPAAGRYEARSLCSDADNADLHGRIVTMEARPYTGANRLLRHGPLRVAADRRHLEHRDGTPFFWLGDTWWMGFCARLHWPDEFQALTADRAAKGFTVAQIVAGLYPDMQPFDPRGANEAGFPWTEGFGAINPAYFDMADLRIAHLVRAGIVPCIVGSWGFFLEFAGRQVLEDHWRYLVARYSAYPVVWCAAGEALMPYYLSPQHGRSSATWTAESQAAWSALARTIRSLDPAGHPISIHPTRYGRQQVDDPTVLDFEMLQTGHSGYRSLASSVDALEESLAAEPKMPVLVDEANYEGILESSREEVQRFLFWSSMLTGACGHTYGANGLWQVNSAAEPYGPSPHGTSWGDTPWQAAAQLPGSRQLGLGKALLERYRWWEFTPHPEWVAPHQTPDDRMSAYAAGIPDQVRVIYIPAETIWMVHRQEMAVKALEPGAGYRAFYFNPKTGTETQLGTVEASVAGDYILPRAPVFQDWVLILERTGAG